MIRHISPTEQELKRFHDLMRNQHSIWATKEQVETIVTQTMRRCERGKLCRQEARALAYRDSPFRRIGPCVYPGRVRDE